MSLICSVFSILSIKNKAFSLQLRWLSRLWPLSQTVARWPESWLYLNLAIPALFLASFPPSPRPTSLLLLPLFLTRYLSSEDRGSCVPVGNSLSLEWTCENDTVMICFWGTDYARVLTERSKGEEVNEKKRDDWNEDRKSFQDEQNSVFHPNTFHNNVGVKT